VCEKGSFNIPSWCTNCWNYSRNRGIGRIQERDEEGEFEYDIFDML
jgi:hypothetical protein